MERSRCDEIKQDNSGVMKLSKITQDELEFPVNSMTYWADPTLVLKYIHNEKKRFHTFESDCLQLYKMALCPVNGSTSAVEIIQ